MVKRLFYILIVSMTLASLGACSPEVTGGSEPASPKVDREAPVIKVYHSSVDITGVEQITISGNQLFIGSLLVASWTDNVSKNCLVSMKIDGSEVTSGQVPIVSGTLSLTVTDEAGNSSVATIKLKMQETHPDITIYKSEVNIFGGATLGIHSGYLSINDEEVMAWSDRYTENCSVAVTFDGNTLSDEAVLSQAGTLTVTVTNRQGKSSVAEITLVSKAITGMEALSLQVDTEVDLISGVTLADGATVMKVEILQDGKQAVIADPTRFTPEYPGTCTLIYTVEGRDGSTTEERLENVTIKPLDYTAPGIATASMISTTYPWYNNLQQSTRQFIYPHLQASYAACNHSKLANRVHIIFGETYEGADNIGAMSAPTDHAYEGYWRIISLVPGNAIKCVDSYSDFEEYYNEHPNECYFASRASDNLLGYNMGQIESSPYSKPLTRLLNKKNFVLSVAIGNRSSVSYKTFNENVSVGNYYNSSSINSNYHNKISVSGYYASGRGNFFAQANESNKGLSSKMPVGFDITKGNILMPMPAVIGSNNRESTSTASSFPTAVTSAVVGNAVAVVMGNRAGITPVDAMEVIVNNYLREETFQYMDETTNWELADGGKWYFLKMDELLNNELLQAGKLETLNLAGDDVALPQGKGICYVGKGVQFEVDGTRHNLSDASALSQALKAGNAHWYWNRSLWRKQGGTNQAELDVYVTDLNGKTIPDLHLTVTKNVF